MATLELNFQNGCNRGGGGGIFDHLKRRARFSKHEDFCEFTWIIPANKWILPKCVRDFWESNSPRLLFDLVIGPGLNSTFSRKAVLLEMDRRGYRV